MNNDLISRETLRNVILNDRKLDGANANWEVNRILVHIDNAPTVDITEEQAIDKLYKTGWLPMHDKEMTERPQGEWSFNPYDSYSYCSLCKVKAPFGYKNFCPNCGADMRKGGTE